MSFQDEFNDFQEEFDEFKRQQAETTKPNTIPLIMSGIALMVALAAGVLGLVGNQPEAVSDDITARSFQTEVYNTDGGDRLVVDDGGDIDIGGNLEFTPGAFSLTGAQTLTPTATFYQVSSASLLTLTIATGAAEGGDVVLLQNTSAVTHTIADTGATVGGSTRSFSPDDLIGFIFDGSNWIEAFYSLND